MIDIFKRWFFHSKEQDMDDCQNPWAGLASYEDPETAERKLKFCGRDDDSYDLARLIMGNVFVTLYGKSGIGKTSLLNAGVFPELREEQYTPVSIRFGMRDDEHPQSYQTMIVEAVERIVKRIETINVIDEQQDQHSIDYLWNYFARHRFYDRYDEPTTPVIVFDQFEEVFRGYRDEAESLLRQLDYLNDKDHALDSCEVDGLPYRYEQNFRFVVSIREDDLYRLEDSIDNCYLPALKRCRYRLRSLSEEGARDAILIPSEGLFKADEKDTITKAILSKSRNDDGSISTNIISLLCSRIFVDFKKSDADHISLSLVDNFIKGNPFECFHNEATRGFSNKEKSYIEDNLVDSTGRRNSIPISDFEKHVPKGMQLLEGDTRILQRTSTSIDGDNYRIELIHDSFCEPLKRLRGKREKRKRMRLLAIVSCIAILCMFVIFLITYQMKEIQQANKKMIENQFHYIAEKANMLVENGDSYLASLLALKILPNDLKDTDVPYLPEAENALRAASQIDEFILRGHKSFVYNVKYSPDGKYLASASRDSTIRIWDTLDGSCIKILRGHKGIVLSVEFSPDGRTLASASDDHTIKIWNFETGECIKTLRGHKSGCNSISLSQNGALLASSSFDDETILLWNVGTGNCVKTIKRDGVGINSVTFSPNGSRLLFACNNNNAELYDIASGKTLAVFKGHTGPVQSAEFSPNGKRIVTASKDFNVCTWDIESKKCLSVLQGHSSYVYSATYSPDGKKIMSASGDKTIRIWNEKGDCIGIMKGHNYIIQSATYSPDGKHIASASWDNTIKIWDVESHTNSSLTNVRTVSYSSDGRYILSASPNLGLSYCNILDTESNAYTSIDGPSHGSWSACFSPDGKAILTASGDHTARIWDATTHICIRILTHPDSTSANILYASFSPDGKTIVTACDSTLFIWDYKTGQIKKTLKGHTSYIYSTSFSPDGSKILSASADNTARIWDVKSGRAINTFVGHFTYLFSASYSRDGKYVATASGDETIRLWDAESGQCIKILQGHTSAVLSVEFRHDGKYLLSSSWDQTVRIWDLETDNCIWIIPCPSNSAWCTATFSLDGKQIVTKAGGKRAIVRDFLPLQDLINQTRERFKNRKLTYEERRKYYLE